MRNKYLELDIIQLHFCTLIHVAKQTHRCIEFGWHYSATGRSQAVERTSTFEAGNGIMLKSANVPDVEIFEDSLYVRGDVKDADHKIITIPNNQQGKKFLSRLHQAVSEYNTHSGKQNSKKKKQRRGFITIKTWS